MKFFSTIKRTFDTDSILVIILIVGIFLRFYDSPMRYGLDFDSSRDAVFALLGATQGFIPPIGPASALGSFHFGPLYYYQLIFSHLIFPILYAPWLYTGLLSVLSIYFGFKLGEELGSKKLGLIIAGFAAVSPAQLLLSTGLSNPNLVVLPSFIAVWLAVKLLKKNTSWYWTFLFGLVLGVGSNNHYQMFSLLSLPFFVFFMTPQKKLTFIVSFIGGFLLPFVPLTFYEFQHNFRNSSGFMYYLIEGRNTQYIPNSWRLYLGDFWPLFLRYVTGLSIYPILVVSVLSILSFFHALQTKKISRSLCLLLSVGIIQVLFLRYIANREYYYVVFLQPFLFLFFSLGINWILSRRYGTIVGILSIVALITLASPQIIKAIEPPDSYFETKVMAEYLHEQYPNNNIEIYNCGERIEGKVMGVVYLMTEYTKREIPTVKIGIHDGASCKTELLYNPPVIKQLPQSTVQTLYDNRMLQFVELANTDTVASSSGWKKITPQSIYEENVEKNFK